MITPTLTPFEWAVTHLQLIGWPAVCIGIYKATRFFTRMEGRIEDASEKFVSMHKVVTNGLSTAVPQAVEVLKEHGQVLHDLKEAMLLHDAHELAHHEEWERQQVLIAATLAASNKHRTKKPKRK